MDKNKATNAAKVAANVTAATAGGITRSVFKIIGTILAIFLMSGLLFTCIFAYYVKTTLSKNLDISLDDMTVNLSSTIYYTDENGNEVEMATFHGMEDRVWVDYENIPKYMSQAAIAIEDHRFMTHKGVDWYRTFGAFINMFATMKDDFGGSTITQQLIKNLTQEKDITVQRKLLEIFRALDFERMYEKDEIMEWYLNYVNFGGTTYGVGAAANRYFDKDVWDLSLAECASIVGITNNPSKYDPYISRSNNKERQELILHEMYEQGFIDYETYESAVNEELVFLRGEDEDYQMVINSWYADVVYNDVVEDLMEEKGIDRKTASYLVNNGGYKIYACMDARIQKIVDNIYEDRSQFQQVTSRKTGEPLQSACVIQDPYTGDIVALSGGIGKKDINLGFNRATNAKRPPGSSIKPIATYGPAIDQGLISPNTLVNDAPNIVLKGTSWYPHNAGGGNRGVCTILQAITSSLNTVSAQILDKLTPAVSYQYLTERLGMDLDPRDCSYAPLSLGQLTNGCTVREMTQAFSAFVNDGIFTYGRTYTHVTDSEGKMVLDNQPETIVAFKANTAWNMCYMLNYAATYGTGSESNLGIMPHAGKTGSSSDYKDRWFVGFTPYYVAGVWTGFDTPEHLYVYGNPSSQIWRKIMLAVHEGLEYKTFKTPTISGPTNIFGDLRPESSESPEPTESEDPSESETPSESEAPPSETPSTDTDIPSPPTTEPTAPPPTDPVTPTIPPEVPDTPAA